MTKSKVRGKPRDGFTLLELLVVLAIGGLLVALVPPMISAAVPGAKLKSATLDLAATLREARNRAISRGIEIDVVIFTEKPGYAIVGETLELLPIDVDLNVRDGSALVAAQSSTYADQGLDDQFTMRFYPDGSASGAAFKVSNRRSAYQIDVDWLIGSVSVSRGADGVY